MLVRRQWIATGLVLCGAVIPLLTLASERTSNGVQHDDERRLQPRLQQRISVEFSNHTCSETLAVLSHRMGLSIVGAMPTEDVRITLQAEDVSAETVLDQVTQAAGGYWFVQGKYVVLARRKAPLRTWTAETVPPRQMRTAQALQVLEALPENQLTQLKQGYSRSLTSLAPPARPSLEALFHEYLPWRGLADELAEERADLAAESLRWQPRLQLYQRPDAIKPFLEEDLFSLWGASRDWLRPLPTADGADPIFANPFAQKEAFDELKE